MLTLPSPAQVKPLFKSTRSLPTVETSPQAAPQTYAEYAISGPPGGAGAPHPTGPEPLAGETPNQAPKPGAKSSSIIVSPRQVRRGWRSEALSFLVGNSGYGEGVLVGTGRKSELWPLCSGLRPSFIHPFKYCMWVEVASCPIVLL